MTVLRGGRAGGARQSPPGRCDGAPAEATEHGDTGGGRQSLQSASGGHATACRRVGERGQTLVLGAFILALVVLPFALMVFEVQMAHGTSAALQQAARGAALDALSGLDPASLAEGTPRLDSHRVQMIVEQSLRVTLQQTAPEVTASAAAAAAQTAATTGTQINGLAVCVSVAVPVHLLTNARWGWTYAACSCARAVVPSPPAGP